MAASTRPRLWAASFEVRTQSVSPRYVIVKFFAAIRTVWQEVLDFDYRVQVYVELDRVQMHLELDRFS